MATTQRVYQDTTQPLTKFPLDESNEKAAATTEDAMRRRQTTTTRFYYNREDKSDLGPDFVAPDGGWSWMVCIAAGLSNLSTYPCLQQFGFIYKDHLKFLGLSNSQITTIINTNSATAACSGLLNGPMFRRFTFRQVAIVGALCCFLGIALTAFCDTFITYMVTYALLFGFGMGISVSASSLAINTYFQQKRRRAAGFSWTITGLGPIFLPYLVTYLLGVYDIQSVVLIFAAISLHALFGALIFQPVRYHINQPQPSPPLQPPQPLLLGHTIINEESLELPLCSHCSLQQQQQQRQRRRETGGIFSSQYLCQDDDIQRPGYEIIEPGTPMLSRANDGWYGSKLSLTSSSGGFRAVSSCKDLELAQQYRNKIISEENEIDNDDDDADADADEADDDEKEEMNFFRPNNFARERDEVREEVAMRRGHSAAANLGGGATPCSLCTCAKERNNNNNQNDNSKLIEMREEKKKAKLQQMNELSFRQKLVTFFDLDLMRDFTFVNLVAGMTMINFGELNFSILTPLILSDFGFETSQITLAMSLLASMDLMVRFLVPFCTEHIAWDNRVFFLIGVVGIAIGRTVVACSRSYPVIIGCFVWIGLCKGVRTIFWPLIIPGYVPLNRLPGASGLQLLISGLFTLACGPLVGLVRDRFNYSVTLHCLNIMSFVSATSWILEALIRRHHKRRLAMGKKMSHATSF